MKTINLPNVVADLVEAQAQCDSVAYASCFSETAVVYDEGKTHKGKDEIRQWIAEANKKYETVMEPIGFTQTENACLLLAEISGSFEGSPIVLNYFLVLRDGLIQSLKITG